MVPVNFKFPLSCHFVWHPFDSAICEPLLEEIRKVFARDVKKPFSRGINIPLFFYSASNGAASPVLPPEELARINLVFIFTSSRTLTNKTWGDYYGSIKESKSLHIIPVAIDAGGLKHKQPNFGSKNSIRLYESRCVSSSIISIAHEIYRYGFNDIQSDSVGKDYSLKLFLSHAKADILAVNIATKLYELIDRTNLNRFFDAHDISAGFSFNDEIQRNIELSTLICIHSDTYSSRYWCQREIIHAKKYLRPIVAVCCLEEHEDRVLPAASNIPCLHIPHDEEVKEDTLYRILQSAILETLRCLYATRLLEFYKENSWIPSDCEILPRPPEIRQVLQFKKKGLVNKVCYPEPSLYSEEQDWLVELNFKAFTPLTVDSDKSTFDGLSVGISISDCDFHDFSSFHQHPTQLKRLSQDISRHLLARKAHVCYGGDLRDDGFTQFILDEAAALNNRLMSDEVRVYNHLAWPIYLPQDDSSAWRVKYSEVLETVEHPPAIDVLDKIDFNVYIKPNIPENIYIWSRCLTIMREKMVESNDARVFAAGRLTGYKGSMIGVLEELLIAVERNIPVYLIGGFGGATSIVCRSILDGRLSTELTEEWQFQNNSGYASTQEVANEYGFKADYTRAEKLLGRDFLDGVAANSGLSRDEYLRLMTSKFSDECCYLVIKGLMSIHK